MRDLTDHTVLEFENKDLVPLLFGAHNEHLSHLEKQLGVSIADRGNRLALMGAEGNVREAKAVLQSLWRKLEARQDVGIAEIDAELRFLRAREKGNGKGGGMGDRADIAIKTKKKTIIPRSPHQADYLEAMRKYELVFGLGPAGTGKTYLAVAMAVSMYLDGAVERLIFCRPAVEAGEHLGFLPGDMKEKVDPYLRPIYDALHDMLPWDVMMKKMETGDIEIAPLAFMRGRTLGNAFVILDEGQNATPGQMKMFLTRLGECSRMVVTGDLTQTDLPKGVKSGLLDARETLEGVEGIAFREFDKNDVVRHPLVGKIVDAYDRQS